MGRAFAVAMLIATCTSNARTQTRDSIRDAATPALSTALSYSGEVVGDVAGGLRRGATYAGAASAQLTVLLRRIVGWSGLQLFVFALDTHGGAPSDLAGDVQGVSNLQAPARLQLEEAWLQQNSFGNRLSVNAGKYDLNSEFYRLQSGGLFVNSSFGIGPEFAQSGTAGPSIFPSTSVGARVAFKPTPNVVWRTTVLDGVPFDRAHASARLFAPGDGALLVTEVAILERPDSAGMNHDPRFLVGRGLTRPYTGKLAIGAWYYTALFPDLVDTMTSGSAVEHRGSGGAYVIADRTVWSANHGGPASLSTFAQLGIGDSRVDRIDSYVGGGLTFTAPLASRPHDELGLAAAWARDGSHYERMQLAVGASTSSEATIELTYLAPLASWLAVQPDLQYVVHPGNAPTARYALVPGLRIALSH